MNDEVRAKIDEVCEALMQDDVSTLLKEIEASDERRLVTILWLAGPGTRDDEGNTALHESLLAGG